MKHILTSAIRLWSIVALSAALAIGLSSAPTLAADAGSAETALEAVCAGIGSATGAAGSCDDPQGAATIDSTVATIINILSLAVGVISVIMIIVGGLKYTASQGESSGISSAKNTIIYAIIGLIIVALAQVIVRFVVVRATETPTPAPATPTS